MADPVGSIFYEYFRKGSLDDASQGKFLVEGVGKGNIPGALNMTLVDRMIRVSDTEAFSMAHLLAQSEGMMVGGSAGLNVFAAIKLANTLEEDATIVTVMPDCGLKYLSKIFNHDWLEEHDVAVDVGLCTPVPPIGDAGLTERLPQAATIPVADTNDGLIATSG